MPQIEYDAPVKVLVAVRGHPFDRTAFDAMFQAMDGITATMVDQPAAAQLMNPDGMEPYDALVLYDMPGMNFAANPVPGMVEPPAALKQGFRALLEQGKGIVALHHALAGWPAWPEYGEWLGGTFLYRPALRQGSMRPDSGYRHGVDYEASVVAPDHPVMAGLPARFAMTDELYLAEIFDDGKQPLLRCDYRFAAHNFHSAALACDGAMYSNEGWEHPDGSDVIGWAKTAINSPLVYLQPGDDQATYDNPNYRRLLENAIRHVAGKSRKG